MWMGCCCRFGAERRISTFLPLINLDMLADSLAASHAGFSIGRDFSMSRSTSPPCCLSSTREPNSIVLESVPASSCTKVFIAF